MTGEGGSGRGALFWTIAIFVLVLGLIDLVFPALASAVTGSANLLPVPRTLRLWYLLLVAAALAVYVLSSEATVESFLAPIRRAAGPDASRAQRLFLNATLVLIPTALAAFVFLRFVPAQAELPSGTRQQHPGTGSASAAPYAGRENPLRKPTEAMLAAFRERYPSIPGPDDAFDSRPKKVELGAASPALLKELFTAEALTEGRALYFKNCQPCHGAKLDGDGPAARAWSLKPIDFTDPGTIVTLVEDAVFWRVNEGGVGLPPAGTPWDSAMPSWKADLTEDEVWKIVTAVYDEAGVKPRVLEFRLEGKEAHP